MTNAEKQRKYRQRKKLIAGNIPSVKSTSKRIHKTEEEKKLSRKAYQKNFYKNQQIKMKKLVMFKYGNGFGGCVECGEKRIACLSIDHILGNGAEHRRADPEIKRLGFYKWLIKNNFPEGFQTLCMNCQWVKRDKYNETRK